MDVGMTDCFAHLINESVLLVRIIQGHMVTGGFNGIVFVWPVCAPGSSPVPSWTHGEYPGLAGAVVGGSDRSAAPYAREPVQCSARLSHRLSDICNCCCLPGQSTSRRYIVTKRTDMMVVVGLLSAFSCMVPVCLTTSRQSAQNPTVEHTCPAPPPPTRHRSGRIISERQTETRVERSGACLARVVACVRVVSYRTQTSAGGSGSGSGNVCPSIQRYFVDKKTEGQMAVRALPVAMGKAWQAWDKRKRRRHYTGSSDAWAGTQASKQAGGVM
ncbi:hypothetical protein IWZ01DRAFT_129816 [Phyllosticta capitalensis]